MNKHRIKDTLVNFALNIVLAVFVLIAAGWGLLVNLSQVGR